MTQDMPSGITSDDKTIAALAYPLVIVVPLIILLTESKTRPFQRYHAIQSLGLTAFFTVAAILLCIVISLLQIIPCLGQLLGLLLALLYLVPIVLVLYYAYKAYQGEMFEIPGLTAFMKQQGWV